MRIYLTLIALVFAFFSCQKEDLESNNRAKLNAMFNGKYEILNSTSKIPVDLNNDGIESTNLLDENSMILFSFIEIIIPFEGDHFLNQNEFVFSEFWPTENELRLQNKEIIEVHKTRFYSLGWDIYCNLLIGEFNDNLSSAIFKENIPDDGKNTLIKLKSIEILTDETIKVSVVRKLYTMNGWVTTEIESLYKKYTTIT